MTVSVDYTQLDQPRVLLFVQQSQGGWWSVTDQHGRLFTPPSTLNFCLKFMEAMRDKKHALIDEAGVEYARCLRVFGEFPSSGEGPSHPHGRIPTDPKAQRAAAAPVSLAAPHGEPAPSPDTYSVRVPMADVIPIGRNA